MLQILLLTLDTLYNLGFLLLLLCQLPLQCVLPLVHIPELLVQRLQQEGLLFLELSLDLQPLSGQVCQLPMQEVVDVLLLLLDLAHHLRLLSLYLLQLLN